MKIIVFRKLLFWLRVGIFFVGVFVYWIVCFLFVFLLLYLERFIFGIYRGDSFDLGSFVHLVYVFVRVCGVFGLFLRLWY